MHPLAAPVAIIWDGSRQVAVQWREAVEHPLILAAEHATGQIHLVAAADAGFAAPLAGRLPAGCRAVHLVSAPPGGALRQLPVQLDERLLPEQVAGDLTGLERLNVREAQPGAALVLDRRPPDAPPSSPDGIVASGLNRVATTADGGSRLFAGPFRHPADAAVADITLAATRTMGAGLVLTAAGGDGAAIAADLLVAHLPAAMRTARDALAGIDADLRLALETELDSLFAMPAGPHGVDASGLGRVAALRRGFLLLRPEPAAAGATLTLADWHDGDELVVFSAAGREIRWTGTGEPARGAPMTIRSDGGEATAVSHRRSYVPSAATGLVVGGSSRALAVSSGEARAPVQSDLGLAAERLATELLARGRSPQEGRITAIMVGWTQAGDGPLGRLSVLARGDETEGGLLAALGAGLGLDPARTAELATRSLPEQIGFLLWGIAAPRLAARACAARLLLPVPGQGPAQAELERLLAWYGTPALPQQLGQAAMLLAGHDRQASRLLHDIAAQAGEGWLDHATLAEVEAALATASRRNAAPPPAGLAGLLAELRRGPRPAQPLPGLEELARLRSELSARAVEAGIDPAIVAELGARLHALAPADIALLHGHLAARLRHAAQRAAALVQIDAWEKAAGTHGLAARADQAGDALVGAARLCATMPSLAEIELLRPALAALDQAIAQTLGPAEGDDPEGASMRRTLRGYGRLLLQQSVLRQADAVFAGTAAGCALADRTDAGFGAAYRRLRAGTGDTLARYLAAANALAGVEQAWGEALAAPRRTATI